MRLISPHIQVTEIDWLRPLGLETQKCSQTDFNKRREILSEFVYYVFDSLLIPLIRSNFYVTESSVHRYRLFFFRHDVWKNISEPAMAQIKSKMFEEVKLADAMKILDSRRLGYSQIRLLPKQTSVRPIMNLRRRVATSKDKKILGQSINSILGPVSSILKLEKVRRTDASSSRNVCADCQRRLSILVGLVRQCSLWARSMAASATSRNVLALITDPFTSPRSTCRRHLTQFLKRQ